MKRTLIIFCVAATIAYLLVMLGTGNWLARMSGWLFYKDWIISTLSAFAVLLYFDRIHGWLDNRYPWFKNPRRLLIQVLLLALAPLGMAVLITYLQYRFIYNQGLIKHEYFQNEFLVTLLILGVVNLCYFIIFLLKRYQSEIKQGDVDGEISHQLDSNDREVTVIGQRGAQQVPVQESDIAMIRLKSKVVFLKTFEGHQLILPDNLDKYEQELPGIDFFRANRQTIVHRRACLSFESIENGKIRIELIPSLAQTATVSQKKAARFREWIRN